MQLELNGRGLCADVYCFVNLPLVNSLSFTEKTSHKTW